MLTLTMDGRVYDVSPAKGFILIQNTATLPEEMEGEAFVVSLDPRDEESGMFEVRNSTRDPVYVELCRRGLAMMQRGERGLVRIPTEAEASEARKGWKWSADGVLTRPEALPV